MGRSFSSPAGLGVYLSVILRPECAAQELMHLTCAAAVAMCDAVESAAGFRPGIKWTNDLVYGTKKLGGILTELSADSKSGLIDYAVVGIGINCNQSMEDFPPELRSIATSLSLVNGQPMAPTRLAAAMIGALVTMDQALLTQKPHVMAAYRNDCVTLGREVVFLQTQQEYPATAVDLDENGGLIVRLRDGSFRTVTSGEVSVRGMYGYI